MNALERLRQAIDQQQGRLRAAVPEDRQAAILALLDAQDRHPHPPDPAAPPDIVTGRRMADPGWNKALQLCLEADDGGTASAPGPSADSIDAWRTRFLDDCGRLAEVE